MRYLTTTAISSVRMYGKFKYARKCIVDYKGNHLVRNMNYCCSDFKLLKRIIYFYSLFIMSYIRVTLSLLLMENVYLKWKWFIIIKKRKGSSLNMIFKDQFILWKLYYLYSQLQVEKCMFHTCTKNAYRHIWYNTYLPMKVHKLSYNFKCHTIYFIDVWLLELHLDKSRWVLEYQKPVFPIS